MIRLKKGVKCKCGRKLKLNSYGLTLNVLYVRLRCDGSCERMAVVIIPTTAVIERAVDIDQELVDEGQWYRL